MYYLNFGASEIVEGFSVFRSSETLQSDGETNSMEVDLSQQRKEIEKQLEVEFALSYVIFSPEVKLFDNKKLF